jgi:Trypsin-like peptidase domain
VQVATLAHRFFALIHDADAAQLINQPADAGTTDAWPVAYFHLYLQKIDFPRAADPGVLSGILCAMESAGLLLRAGWRSDLIGTPMMGQLYVSQGSQSPQINGNLWLSKIFGAELIIESYNWVTLLIGGGEGQPVGTGLVLDRTHVVTNHHVIEGLVGPGVTGRGIEILPSFTAPGAEPIVRQSRITGHGSLDVAVIEVELPEDQPLLALSGMTFRDPKWHDEVCVFGYPYVPGLTERPITVERGQVVNPATEAARMAGYPRQKTFLTSAVARPGNSGGPIVAQDGRVIGLVVEDARAGLSRASAGGEEPAAERRESGRTDSESQSEGSGSPPFYRGIPGSEVVRAIKEIDLGGDAVLENL